MPEKSNDKPSSSRDIGQSEVQDHMDEETDQGFRGETADDTPNEHYTVQGVVANKPTPENSAGRKES